MSVEQYQRTVNTLDKEIPYHILLLLKYDGK